MKPSIQFCCCCYFSFTVFQKRDGSLVKNPIETVTWLDKWYGKFCLGTTAITGKEERFQSKDIGKKLNSGKKENKKCSLIRQSSKGNFTYGAQLLWICSQQLSGDKKNISLLKDHRSNVLNWRSWEKKAWKNSGLNRIRTHDLCDTSTAL